MGNVDHCDCDDGYCGADACPAVDPWVLVEVRDCCADWRDGPDGCRSGPVGT